MVFQQKLLGKAYFIVKITAPAMIWPVSSKKWKAPLGQPRGSHFKTGVLFALSIFYYFFSIGGWVEWNTSFFGSALPLI